MEKELELKALGEVKQFLGFTITRDRRNRKLWYNQSKFIKKALANRPVYNKVKTP